MGKMKICRICRSEKNLKYTTKELRQLNKKQLLLAQATQQGQENSKASKKLLLTTPTLGNICRECDERLQIFHRLDDDGDHGNCSDIEIDVVNNTSNALQSLHLSSSMSKDFLQRRQRPETPVIVDDNDMLYNIFMQKIDEQKQFRTKHHTDATILEQQSQQFVNQFHTTYTPPQSSAGGSEGDESKVVEILTSRESTPALTNAPVPEQTMSSLVDEKGYRIVAIIELDDCEDNESKNNEGEDKNSGILTPVTNCSNDLSFTSKQDCSSSQNSQSQNFHKIEDDEEIVFRKVDSEKDNFLTSKKRQRKSYDDRQLRLVASLSLVSSDSEAEETPVSKILSETDRTDSTIKVTAVTKVISKETQKFETCDFCNLRLPDSESLTVHQRIHKGEKCILCQVGFTQIKRLIHHMRRKHRSYNGKVLSEKPRSGQDSCMTIRLRYMQHTTYYECQLCGRIDDIFKEHKDHILEKHANESKSLKDPIMKQLKCPVCKVKCGAQYLSLCRHLIASHKYQEYKSQLRELVHVNAFGWNAARQQEVAKTAKIFQFVKRKTFFFECKICRKVVAGYLHHLRHVTNHQRSINKNKASCPTKLSKECTKELEKSSNAFTQLNKAKQPAKKQQFKELLETKNNNVKIGRKILTYKKCEMAKTCKRNNSNLSVKSSPKDLEAKSSYADTKNKVKPKDTAKNKQSVIKLTKAKPKKDSGSSKIKNNEKLKLKGKGKDNVQKPQVIKVKIKPPIRQIDLQKFKCIYCLKKFKGFRVFNLHLLQQHKEDEYSRCLKCNKAFKNSLILEEHRKHCTHLCLLLKRKSKTCSTLQNCGRSSKEVPETCEVRNNIENNNYQWLQDLLKLNESSKVSDSNTNTALYNNNNNNINLLTNFQCSYCLHLFTDENNLNDHIKERHSQKDVIFIKYKPL